MTNILNDTSLQTYMKPYSELHNLQFVLGKAFAYWSCDTVTFNSTMHVELTFKERIHLLTGSREDFKAVCWLNVAVE
jgi:hypothetical protein